MNKDALVAVIEEALEEYAEDGGSFDETDLRDILDNLVEDFRNLQKFL